MRTLKDSPQAKVTLLQNNHIHKVFRGPAAKERFLNEVQILMHLQEQGCDCVPRLRRIDMHGLAMETTCVGKPVERLSDEKVQSLFQKLESYGVIHDDPFLRNITYDPIAGQFFIIDFEYAAFKDSDKGFTQKDLSELTADFKTRSRMENAAIAANL